MPQFGSPITPGYGIGQIGAGISQGLLRGQIEAPQIGYEQLRNQALQRQLVNEQAQQQVLSTEAPTQEGQQDLTPLDKPLRDMEAQMTALRQAGQGQAVQKMMPEYIQMSQQRHVAQIGLAARNLLGPNPKSALPYMKQAGFGDVSDVSSEPDPQNPQNRIFTFTMPDGSTSQMSAQQVAMVADKPEMMAQHMAMQNLYGARIQNYQNLGESREAQNALKSRAQAWKEQTFPELLQNKKEVAGIGAGGKTGAAQISANERNFEFMNNPEHAMISSLVDSGLPYQDAYQATQLIKQGQRGSTPESLATSMLNHELQSNPMAFPNQEAKDKFFSDRVALIKGLQGGKKSVPAAPVIPKGATVLDTTGLPQEDQAQVNKMSNEGARTADIQNYIKDARARSGAAPQAPAAPVAGGLSIKVGDASPKEDGDYIIRGKTVTVKNRKVTSIK